MTAADRLNAIERAVSDIPEKARANRRYQDFFNVADVTALAAALRAVLDLHHPVLDILPWLPRHPAYCGECSDDEVVNYPCPTVRAIEGALT